MANYPQYGVTGGAFWPVAGCVPLETALAAVFTSTTGSPDPEDDLLVKIEDAANPGVDPISNETLGLTTLHYIYDGTEIRRITFIHQPVVATEFWVSVERAFSSASTQVDLEVTRKAFRSVGFSNTGGANGEINGENFPAGASTSFSAGDSHEADGTVAPFCYDATGTVYSIVIQN